MRSHVPLEQETTRGMPDWASLQESRISVEKFPEEKFDQ